MRYLCARHYALYQRINHVAASYRRGAYAEQDRA